MISIFATLIIRHCHVISKSSFGFEGTMLTLVPLAQATYMMVALQRTQPRLRSLSIERFTPPIPPQCSEFHLFGASRWHLHRRQEQTIDSKGIQPPIQGL